MGKKSINSSAKRKNNNANNSYKVKSAKATKPDKDGFWICGKLGHHKKDCFIYKKKMKAYEEKQGHSSTSNDQPMKGNSIQIDLNLFWI